MLTIDSHEQIKKKFECTLVLYLDLSHILSSQISSIAEQTGASCFLESSLFPQLQVVPPLSGTKPKWYINVKRFKISMLTSDLVTNNVL